jgi:Family of unknown function (DUF5678)
MSSPNHGGLLMLAVKDISKLLAGVPKGAWVALSRNEERVVAYAAELQEAIEKAKAAGENDPLVVRVPEDGSTLLL